jgi:uncharacterized protein (TIGR03437 family)
MNHLTRTNAIRLLSLTVLAFGYAATLAAAPNITGVVNAASWLPPGLPNSGIAQGAVFTLTGTGLGPSTLQEVSGYPLPTEAGLGGTTITITTGDTAVFGIMVYTLSTQVAAILPSSTPVGPGILKLSYRGASSTIAIQVVAASFGTSALNEGGSGPAVITDPSYTPITYVNAAHPGDTLILWGTGLGATTGDETEPPPAGVNLDVGEVQVLVGNQLVTPEFAGRSSSPGLDQINFVVPAGIPPACKMTIAVIVHGVTGNVTSTSIAPAGQTTCGDTFNALTTANLQEAMSTGSLNIAGVSLTNVNSLGDVFTGLFGSFTLNTLVRSYGGTLGPSIGNCLVYENYGALPVSTDPVHATPLAAGPQLMVTGPSGKKTVDATSTGFYQETLATASPFFIAPGNFTVTNGAGEPTVPAFTWDLTLPAPVVPTNIPASFNPAQDLTLTWTGGSAFPVAIIYGFGAALLTSFTEFSWAELICTADGSAGTFTIPSALLSLFPPDGYGAVDVKGVGFQIAGLAESHFTVTGSPGLDEGFFTAFKTNGAVAKIQ